MYMDRFLSMEFRRGYGLYNRLASLNTFYEGRECVDGEHFLIRNRNSHIFNKTLPFITGKMLCSYVK